MAQATNMDLAVGEIRIDQHNEKQEMNRVIAEGAGGLESEWEDLRAALADGCVLEWHSGERLFDLRGAKPPFSFRHRVRGQKNQRLCANPSPAWQQFASFSWRSIRLPLKTTWHDTEVIVRIGRRLARRSKRERFTSKKVV